MGSTRHSLRQRPWLLSLLAALLLSASILTWAHAAEHAGETTDLAGACASCDWSKHSPAVRTVAVVMAAQPLTGAAAPARPVHPDLVAPHAPAAGRAPPAA